MTLRLQLNSVVTVETKLNHLKDEFENGVF
jgi:hypothetical protein